MREPDVKRFSQGLATAELYYHSLAQLSEIAGVGHSLRTVLNEDHMKIDHNVLNVVVDTLSRMMRKLYILVTEFDSIIKPCF